MRKRLASFIVIVVILLGFGFTIMTLENNLYNNGYCKICGTAWEDNGYHYEGRSHNVLKYDYICKNGHAMTTTFKY